MKGILLIGGGGHCRAVIDVIEAEGRFRVKGIVQPESDGTEPILGYPILGEDDALPVLLAETPQALVSVGQIKTPAVRQRLFELLVELNALIPVLVSPRAYLSHHAQAGAGTMIMHGAIVNAGARIGVNGIVNSLALIEHDVKVGHHCHLSTGSRINGGVVIENGCFIGSGAVLHEGIRIGDSSVIGAGCIVSRDIAPRTLLKA